MAQSVERPTSAQVMILGWSPASGPVLTAQNLELALEYVSLSLSLSAPPLLALSLSVFQKK